MADNLFGAADSLNEGQSQLNLKEFFAKNIKYLPWILLCGILGGVLGYIKIRYSVPQFKAQSSMLIQNNSLNMEGGGSGTDPKMGSLFMASGTGLNLANEIQILQSRPLLKRVANDLELHTNYYTVGSVKSTLLYKNSPIKITCLDSLSEPRAYSFEVQALNDREFRIGDKAQKYVFGQPFVYNNRQFTLAKTASFQTSSNAPEDQPKYLVVHTPVESVADQLKGSLAVTKIEGTDMLSLNVTDQNPDLCVDILAKVMAVYDSMSIEDKNKVAQITLQFIDNRLDTIRNELSGVEKRLQDFMEKNNLFDIDAQASSYLDMYNEYYKQQSEMNVQVSVLNWLVNYLKNDDNKNKIVPTSLGITEPTLTDYILNYNKLQLDREDLLKTVPETNTLVQKANASLAKMRGDMVEALNNVKASYELTGKNLKTNTSNAQNELQSMPMKARQMLEIKRRQQIMQDLYSFLLQKKIEVSISSASAISISRTVESAVASGAPVSPNKKVIYILFIAAGLAIPTIVAFFIELLNDKVNSRGDIEKITKAPIIGEIGHSDAEDLPLVMKNNSRKFIAEQFRIIRTNLQFVLNKVEKPVIIITSTFSGEGKSFISTNLGGVIALAGKRTLIMEFDIRKPKVVSGLGMHVRKGITNYVVGNASLDDLIVPVEDVPGLFVLPCGPVPPNPAEILLMPAIREIFEYSRKNFDTIIVDTAPVGVVSDALVLSEFANGTLYIVRQGYTYKKQIDFIEDMYRQKKLPGQAIIINDIKHVSGYGGYYGYGYGYASGKKSHYFDEQKKSIFKFSSRKPRKM